MEGDCAEVVLSDHPGRWCQETLKFWTPHPGGTPNRPDQATHMRWFRTHVPMLQHILLTPPQLKL
jgi:hypothetical protein